MRTAIIAMWQGNDGLYPKRTSCAHAARSWCERWSGSSGRLRLLIWNWESWKINKGFLLHCENRKGHIDRRKSTPLRDAAFLPRTLPRPKNSPPDGFLTAFRVLSRAKHEIKEEIPKGISSFICERLPKRSRSWGKKAQK